MPRSYYPPRSLREATIIAKTIVDRGGKQPMMRLTIAQHLDLAPTGRPFRSLITASGGYGLTSGSYIAEEIELRDLGKRLVAGDLEAAYEALGSHELFVKLHEQYKNAKVPSQQAGEDFLKRECGVPEGQLKGVYSRFLQDARDWHIVQEIKGAETVVPLEMARQRALAKPDLPGALAPALTEPEADELGVPVETRKAVKIQPGLQLNIAIHIAADTSEERIETIFKNMKKYLLPDE